MPGKNKVAKKRLDKFYYLAKERGYRSRAAFKLLQLDKKFEFLCKSKGCLDLCAAPGSWMQAARQIMPKDSPIIGVDLAPIKPIPKCSSLVDDITTQKCRAALKRELKGNVVDVVLHDGAPNVGTSWLQDAFGQNELTLAALRLATDFLQPGGCFVTKVFRSNDYNALLYVFNALFHKVEATKPQASRAESAEIFVVCRGFKNATIDPKFLDPKHVFSMVDEDDTAVNVLQQKKGKKARPEGYDNLGGIQLLNTKVSVKDFVLGSTPVKMLGEVNAFTWDESDECVFWKAQKQTKPEILHCCGDLKVLGKREFRTLLQWRLKMTAAWAKEQTKHAAEGGGEGEEGEEGEGEDEEVDPAAAEAAKFEQELEDLEAGQRSRLKGAKRKEAERRERLKERMSLGMEHPGDRLDVTEEAELFSLARIKGERGLDAVIDVSGDVTLDDAEANALVSGVDMGDAPRRNDARAGAFAGGEGDSDSSEEEDYVDKLDQQLETMYEEYKTRTQRRVSATLKVEEQDAGGRSKAKKRLAVKAAEEEEAADDPETMARKEAARELRREHDTADVRDRESDDESDEGGEMRNPLLRDLASKKGKAEARDAKQGRTSQWFAGDLFDEMEEEDDEEDIRLMAEKGRAQARRKRFTEQATKGRKKKDGDDAEEGEAEDDDEAAAGEAGASEAPAAKRAKKGGKAEKDKAAEAEATGGRAWGGPAGERAAGAKRPKGGKEPRETGNPVDMPDDAKFEDEGEQKHVGGRQAQYDSDDVVETMDGAETAQAAIERQAEAIVLGQLLLRGDKKRKLVDEGFNRHANHDTNLPEWFADDERKFRGPAGYAMDLPEDLMEQAREKLRAINASSIKKVGEAKARKARRQQRALTKIKKKASQIASKSDMSEREKSKEVEKLYAKTHQKRERKKVVVAGGGKAQGGRGVKVVDARMKTDTNGEARKQRASKGKGPKGKNQSSSTKGGSRQKAGKKYSRKN